MIWRSWRCRFVAATVPGVVEEEEGVIEVKSGGDSGRVDFGDKRGMRRIRFDFMKAMVVFVMRT